MSAPLPEWTRDEDGVLVADGRILFASAKGAGLFDPAADSWEDIPPMPEPRDGATMSVLRTGAVLIVGGGPATDDIVRPSAVVELLQ